MNRERLCGVMVLGIGPPMTVRQSLAAENRGNNGESDGHVGGSYKALQ